MKAFFRSTLFDFFQAKTTRQGKLGGKSRDHGEGCPRQQVREIAVSLKVCPFFGTNPLLLFVCKR